jgi:hypothetical protein
MKEPRRNGALLVGAAVILTGGSLLLWQLLAPKGDAPPRPSGAAAPEGPEQPAKAAPRAPTSPTADARRARDAKREEILEALRKRGEAIPKAPPSSPSPLSPPLSRPAAAGAAAEPPVRGHYDTEYIRENFRRDMFPLLRSCYENALAQRPNLGGKLVLTFSIVGDPSVGGVVEDADFDEESNIQDPEMETCVRESLMTLVFDKPPEGGGFVTVKYPIEFSPGDDNEDAGSNAGSSAR